MVCGPLVEECFKCLGVLAAQARDLLVSARELACDRATGRPDHQDHPPDTGHEAMYGLPDNALPLGASMTGVLCRM
jgi:hypothetical protein